MSFTGQSDYIWSEADWPKNGWAGFESTPVPTCVSPGVGLGSKKGLHLGLGGATVGTGSLAKPGRYLTGGGAFGIPGYAGIGASGLGWEIQQDFEEFVDQPATVENVCTRALSSHPSRPFFLVGSSNTHIYLWEVRNFDTHCNICTVLSGNFASVCFNLCSWNILVHFVEQGGIHLIFSTYQKKVNPVKVFILKNNPIYFLFKIELSLPCLSLNR